MKLTCIFFSVTGKAKIPCNYPQKIKTFKQKNLGKMHQFQVATKMEKKQIKSKSNPAAILRLCDNSCHRHRRIYGYCNIQDGALCDNIITKRSILDVAAVLDLSLTGFK